MRRIGIATIAAISAFALAVPSASAATPQKVMDDRDVDELAFAASADYAVWSANSQARPRHYNSYVGPRDGTSATRVNPKGTDSYSVGIDGSTVVYQVTNAGGWDLGMYDAATQAQLHVPDGVNTDSYEDRPSLSGDWLLFTRTGAKRARIVLFQISTGSSTVLSEADAATTWLVSDQVNGDWATFERCRVRHGVFEHCNVFRYQISTAELAMVPNPGAQQYAGGVAEDGTVYLARTGNEDAWRCGLHSRIVRYPVGGPAVVIAELRAGFDPYSMFTADEADGSTTVFFYRVRCSTLWGGIYSVANAESAT